MSDLHTMTDEELGRSLTALAGDLAWPNTPDVSAAVVSTIREEHAAPSLVAPRLSLPSRRRTLILVVAAVLALAGIALAARLVFHLGAIGIEIVDGPATSLPSNVVTDADLGREVSLAEATRVAGFTRRSPMLSGPPIDSGSTRPRSTWSPERSRNASPPRGSPPGSSPRSSERTRARC